MNANPSNLVSLSSSLSSFEEVKKPLSPEVELAIRLYCLESMSILDAATRCNLHEATLRNALRNERGKLVVEAVRREMDEDFLNLQGKVTQTLKDGLGHPEPQVALASASLWLKTAKGQKIEVRTTAEDVVKSLIDGPSKEELSGKE